MIEKLFGRIGMQYPWTILITSILFLVISIYTIKDLIDFLTEGKVNVIKGLEKVAIRVLAILIAGVITMVALIRVLLKKLQI